MDELKRNVRAPVVIHRAGARGEGDRPVLLLQAVSEPDKPKKACTTSVQNVGHLCAAAALGPDVSRGAYPFEAFLIDHESKEGRAVEGRSCALALALASLSRWYGLAFRSPVIATGELVESDPGTIRDVDDLDRKLRAAADELRTVGGIVLFPAGNNRHRAPVATARSEATPGVRFVAVATLAEAANEVLVVPDGRRFETARPAQLQAAIERLRLDEERVVELLDRCRALAEEAEQFPAESPYRWTLTFHALNNAIFALSKLARRNESVRWRDAELRPAGDLHGELNDELKEHQRAAPAGATPPELLAEVANFSAIDVGYRHLNFSTAVRIAGDGLAVHGLLRGHHGEHRRLLGTRGQFELRQGLRMLATGSPVEALGHVEQAIRDLDCAVAEAAHVGVADRNDRARALVYHASARLAEEVIRGEELVPERAASVDAERWGRVLGRFLAGEAEPMQDPRWALAFLYSSWLFRGRHDQVVAHFARVGDLPLPGEPTEATCTLATALLDLHDEASRRRWELPTDHRIIAALAEAAIGVGDRDLLDRCCDAFHARSATSTRLELSTLVNWWPTVEAAPECAPARAISAWATGTLPLAPLPVTATGTRLVREALDQLAAEIAGDFTAAHRARSDLRLWLGDIPSARMLAAPDDYPIFVATAADQVPATCRRFVSLDGSVPGHAARFDHHVTGEAINLDAMPSRVSPWAFDGAGTTLADADAAASIAVFLVGGKAVLPRATLAVLESASWWCDHLCAHPRHDAEINRRGRGLLDEIAGRLAEGPRAQISDRFAALCSDLAELLRRGAALPMRDTWTRQVQIAEELDARGRIRMVLGLAVVDLRGAPAVDPLATYLRHRSPVAILVDDHPRGRARYTIGVNPNITDAPRDLRAALHALAAAEFSHGAPALSAEPVPGAENWGGRATVFGSPWNYGSRLSVEEVAAITAAALGLPPT